MGFREDLLRLADRFDSQSAGESATRDELRKLESIAGDLLQQMRAGGFIVEDKPTPGRGVVQFAGAEWIGPPGVQSDPIWNRENWLLERRVAWNAFTVGAAYAGRSGVANPQPVEISEQARNSAVTLRWLADEIDHTAVNQGALDAARALATKLHFVFEGVLHNLRAYRSSWKSAITEGRRCEKAYSHLNDIREFANRIDGELAVIRIQWKDVISPGLEDWICQSSAEKPEVSIGNCRYSTAFQAYRVVLYLLDGWFNGEKVYHEETGGSYAIEQWFDFVESMAADSRLLARIEQEWALATRMLKRSMPRDEPNPQPLMLDKGTSVGLRVESPIALSRTEQDSRDFISVDLPCRSITICQSGKSKTLDCGSVNALLWVRVLSRYPGEWISSTDLKKFDPELTGLHPKDWKEFIPRDVSTLIESKRGAGSRWKGPALCE